MIGDLRYEGGYKEIFICGQGLSRPGGYGTPRGMKRLRSATSRLSLAAGLLALAGCATTPGAYRLAERDPLEKANRVVWSVNSTADKIIVKPVAKGYRAVAPRPVRQGISNFFANLAEPWSFVNNVLQGKPHRAAQNLGRFVVNSTIGIGGLFDPATRAGIPDNEEDLGQTLAAWGVNGGPYLMLPFLGPSTLRDGIGSGVAFYADPVNIGIRQIHHQKWPKYGYRAAYIISVRTDLIESGADTFLETSLDPYAATRSAYLQRRTAAIRDQEDSLDAGPPDDPAAMSDAAAGPPDPPAEAAAAAPGPAPQPPSTTPDAIVKTPEQAAGTPPPQPVTPPRQ